MDKVEWYRACVAHDPAAWEKLHGFLLGVARKTAFALDDADRQDVVQKVLLEAYEAAPASKTDPGAWIPNTVLRLKSRLIDTYRRRKASPEFLPTDPDECPPVAVAPGDPERSAALRQTLLAVFTAARTELRGRCPRVLGLYLRMKAGLDPTLECIDDVARCLELTPNATSVAVHRCIKQLLAVPRVAEALDGLVD